MALEADDEGYFAGLLAEAGPGARYWLRADGGDLLADPASRFQPEGPRGPSQVVDPSDFAWTDGAWRGASLPGQVLYEMHIGTFTPEGTWQAAARQLAELAGLGVTVVELMPVADFVGEFGWGYDGVNLFAPTRLYGTPDDFRRFVDQAHGLGLAVILDVVYNHLGPDGGCMEAFAEEYFSKRYRTEWGRAFNFDDQGSGPVREYFLANAAYWIDEFHLDGLRVDATQQIFDTSPYNIIAAIVDQVRDAAGARATIIIGENEPQQARLMRPATHGGAGLDGMWNDDFHHSAMVVLSGRNEAYYSDHRGSPQEFISAVKWGYLFQGQRYKWQGKPRGTPALDVPPHAFVNYLQNHDQIANSGLGRRCHQLGSPGQFRAMTALFLLAPGTPLLFQGQEFAASTPFFYFADQQGPLADSYHRDRNRFLAQFPSLALDEIQKRLPRPSDPAVFHRCKLDFSDRQSHAEEYALHRDLLRLRREDPVLHAQRKGAVDGAVLGPDAFVLRYFGPAGNDRLLLVNFGIDLQLESAPEPLLAPPEDKQWTVLWASEDPRYGGCGAPPPVTEENWRIPGRAAVLLAAQGP